MSRVKDFEVREMNFMKLLLVEDRKSSFTATSKMHLQVLISILLMSKR